MRDQHRRIRPLVAALTSTVVIAGGLALAGPAVAADDIDLSFDFGGPSSPVADGWIGINPGSTYSADAGYGFTTAPASNGFRDRGGDDAMKGDFTISANQSFALDVPNGTYEITVWAGDLIAGNTTSLDVEGTAYAGPRTTSGVINEKYFSAIEVSDGQLNITVTGGDGRLNGITVQTPLAAPAGLAAAVDAAAPAVNLSWDAAADATGYAVYRAQGADLTEIGRTTDARTFRDTDVEIGETYSYAVATVKGARVSQPSEKIPVEVVDANVTKPAVPTGLAASTVQRNSVTLTWKDAGDARQWKVYRSTRADIAYELVGTVSSPSFTDDDVLTTRPYLYQVAAAGDGGVSARSAVFSTPIATTLVRQAEYLDRAPVAVTVAQGVYLSWRLLGLDDRDLGFNVYRDGTRVNDKPITDSTNLLDEHGTADSSYFVTAVRGSTEVPVTDEFTVQPDQFFDIPLDKPADDVLPDGKTVTYAPGDASVGDLDGDGQYELVFLWSPSISKDNSQSGYTGKVYMDAVKLDGTKLWRIDLGVNIRAGAHYTQFVVFDLDGDGKAEVMFKTADGTVDGAGTVIGDKDADYRNSSGYILDGPEYLTVFNGKTGAAIDTVDYDPGRGNVSAWGDSYGNRVDRFLAGVGFFDGEHPSAVFSRGYYTRTVITTWDLVKGKLVERWKFDSNDAGTQYEGQGNHQMVTADVDRDGLDEIVFGSMTIDDDGTPLYNTKLGHGDALHVGDFVTDRPGLEVFAVHEDVSGNGGIGATMRDAETGEVIWKTAATDDTGRGTAGDIDPTSPGAEAWNVGGNVWNSPTGSLKSEHGDLLSTSIPAANFVINWDGDLSQEIFDHDYDETSATGVPTISEWNPETQSSDELLRLDGTLTNNTTKGNPSLQADLFGDWREEVVVRTDDGNALRVYTTTDVTEHRIPTLMHDSQYRQSIASQNSAYNQPPHTSYYLGTGMGEVPVPSISYTNAPSETVTAAPSKATLSNTSGWATGLADGNYNVEMNLWWGTPGSLFRLYENGSLVATQVLDASGTAQKASVAFGGKKNGTYVYTGELVNAKGVTKTSSTTVKVSDAAPGRVVVSHDNWDGDGSFTATADLWWGTNATSYRFELDGAVVGSGDLVTVTPNGQRASVSLTGVARGTHTIVAVFANAAGETTSAPVTVKVTK